VFAAPLSSASPQEEKQGLQKDASSDESSTKSTMNQHEWETIPINRFWIQKKRKKERKEEQSLINNLSFYLKKIEKIQNKTKLNKDVIKNKEMIGNQ